MTINHLGHLKPDTRNARRHGERNISLISKSLESDGFGRSILLDSEGNILAGNGVTEAAGNVGIEDVIVVPSDGTKVIAIQRTDVAPGSERAVRLAIADNRAQELSDFDPAIVAALSAEVDLTDFWREDELDALLAGIATEDAPVGDDPGADISKGEILSAEYGTESGQLWQLGRHRLCVGDCTDAATVDRLMDGHKADALITDPPYGIGIVGAHGTAGNFPGTNAPRHVAPPIVGDDRPFDPAHLLALAPKLVLWGANHYADKLPAGSKWLIWDKKDGAFDGSDLGDCELAWTNLGGAARLIHHTWQGMYRKGDGERSARLHPTQKAVDVMCWCMEQANLPECAVVLDVYLGSGTTLIAAERTGRVCYAAEISPAYVAVSIRRWEEMTGAKAVCLEGAHDQGIPAVIG